MRVTGNDSKNTWTRDDVRIQQRLMQSVTDTVHTQGVFLCAMDESYGDTYVSRICRSLYIHVGMNFAASAIVQCQSTAQCFFTHSTSHMHFCDMFVFDGCTFKRCRCTLRLGVALLHTPDAHHHESEWIMSAFFVLAFIHCVSNE